MTPVLIDLRLRTMLSNNEFHDMEMEHGDDFWDLYPRRRVVQMLMAEPSPGRGRRFEAPYGTSGGETFTRDAHGVYLTVDERNPAPVDMVNIPLFTGLFTSQVVQDFFHQQYHCITHKIVLYKFVVDQFDMILSSCQMSTSVKFAPGSIQVAADLSGGAFSGGMSSLWTQQGMDMNGWFQTFEQFCRCETAEKIFHLPFPKLTCSNNNSSISRYT